MPIGWLLFLIDNSLFVNNEYFRIFLKSKLIHHILPVIYLKKISIKYSFK